MPFYKSGSKYIELNSKVFLTSSSVDLFPTTPAATFATVCAVATVLATFAAFLTNFLNLLLQPPLTSSVSSKKVNEKSKKYRNCKMSKKIEIINLKDTEDIIKENKIYFHYEQIYHCVLLLILCRKYAKNRINLLLYRHPMRVYGLFISFSENIMIFKISC